MVTDGNFLATTSDDRSIRIWNLNWENTATFSNCDLDDSEDHPVQNHCVSWSPDGTKIASNGVNNRSILITNTENWDTAFFLGGHLASIEYVAWSPDGNFLASSSFDETLRIWDIRTRENVFEININALAFKISWSSDGKKLAAACNDGTIKIWSTKNWGLYTVCKGHAAEVFHFEWLNDGKEIASCSGDATIRIWNPENGDQIKIIEGHSSGVNILSLSSDQKLLASNSFDGTVRIWRCDTWETLAIIKTRSSAPYSMGLSFHPKLNLLATPSPKNEEIRIWEITPDLFFANPALATVVRYTTAKIVLVGDAGVGKTGLGWRISHNEFKEHSSTHGQQFWVVDDLCSTREDGTVCEAVLWDLAGQHVYRSVHSFFLENIDLALIVFDPTNRQEPLKGVEYWVEQLAGKGKLPPTILVGGRVDRGSPVLSHDEFEQFCHLHGVIGYYNTSAKTGLGINDLLKTVRSRIDWEEKTTTVTTENFKKIKKFVLQQKEKTDRKSVLVSPIQLRKKLQLTDKNWDFSEIEMMTAVRHMENHGYVTILHNSAGEISILLLPELLVNLVSSIVLEADKHPRELGELNETSLIQGKYSFPELTNLSKIEQNILIDAATVRFISHNICFRETLGADTLLIFPALIKQKRPLFDDFDTVDDISYIIRGQVENVYPALVVLLGNTQTFTRTHQWQKQTQYEMGSGELCGFRLIEERESEIEIVVYYSRTMPLYGRNIFQGLLEKFLSQRNIEITPFLPISCCNKHVQERTTIIKRVREAKEFVFCDECGEKINLSNIEKPLELGEKDTGKIRKDESVAKLRSLYETHLVRIKGYRRDRASPRCFISYLYDQELWTNQLKSDLRDAGIFILDDLEKIRKNDIILVICSPVYKKAWDCNSELLSNERKIINKRIIDLSTTSSNVVPLLREGDECYSIPKDLFDCQFGDFRVTTHYAVSLFDLVLTLYAIPLNNVAFNALREALTKTWREKFEISSQQNTNGSTRKSESGVTKQQIIELQQNNIDILIITALREELDAVLKQLPGSKKFPPSKSSIYTFYQLDFPIEFPDKSTGNYKIVIMLLQGMGRVHAATATTTAINLWHPRNILLVGIAGGIADNKVKIGDIIIGDQIFDYELQKETGGGAEIRPEVFRADPRLLLASKNLKTKQWQNTGDVKRPDASKPKCHFGTIASGDKVISLHERLEAIRAQWPKLVGVEMEASGTAAAACQSPEKPNFFMIRAVSDLADKEKGTVDVEKWRVYACNLAASYAATLIKSAPLPSNE